MNVLVDEEAMVVALNIAFAFITGANTAWFSAFTIAVSVYKYRYPRRLFWLVLNEVKWGSLVRRGSGDRLQMCFHNELGSNGFLY